MSEFIVKRTAYKMLKQDALASFAENVFNRMSSMPEYQQFSTQVTELGAKLGLYKESLAQAVNGGVDRITTKNSRQMELLKALDLIGDALNASFTGDQTWIVNTGMEPHRGYSTTKIPLEPPFNLRAAGSGSPGEVILQFEVSNRNRIRSYAVEQSIDGGQTWKNGTYSSGTRVRMQGLPNRQDMLFRVRTLGSFDRLSAWSKPVELFVV